LDDDEYFLEYVGDLWAVKFELSQVVNGEIIDAILASGGTVWMKPPSRLLEEVID
jgi:GTPase